MELLIAKNLTRLRDGHALFASLELRLSAGDRLGLVGANGSGKSTLLRLLAGLDPPDQGTVGRAPGVRVALLPQRDPAPLASGGDSSVMAVALGALEYVRALEVRLRREEERIAASEERDEAYAALHEDYERLGGYRAASRLREYLAALGFSPDDLERPVSTLSAGQRRRLSLAQALAQTPDVLLLDEPTNHLDITARAWLANRLTAWRGALVVVSHDRALLAAATQRTAFLLPERQLGSTARSRLKLESGPYDVAKLRLEAVHRSDAKREQLRRKEVARLEAMASELQSFGHKAAARRARAERQRAELQSQAVQASSGSPGSTCFTSARASSGAERPHTTAPGILLEARHLALAGVINDVDIRLEAGQRVALLGANGSGKSALLGLLSGAIAPTNSRAELHFRPGLKLRHLDQITRGVVDGLSVLEQARLTFGNVTAGRLLAQAGLVPSAWLKQAGQLSGGERARVGLAVTLNQEADLWFLDEPSNDLDLAAVEALEAELGAKLTASGAALVLVTHDSRLAASLCNEFWGLLGGDLLRYADVDAYLAGRVLPRPVQRAAPRDEPAVAASALAATATVAAVELEELENERSELMRQLNEHADQSERERRRSQERLGWLEGELMAAYAARLPPPAPRYRLVEGPFTFFADDLSALDGNTSTAPEPNASQRFALVATEDASAAAADLARLSEGAPSAGDLGQGALPAWLELRLADGICHMQLLESPDACLLPSVRAALIDAGVGLAFTRLGAKAVQLFWRSEARSDSLGRSLRPAGDGWWALGLGEFLTLEGWAGEASASHSGRGAPPAGAGKRERRSSRRGRGP